MIWLFLWPQNEPFMSIHAADPFMPKNGHITAKEHEEEEEEDCSEGDEEEEGGGISEV